MIYHQQEDAAAHVASSLLEAGISRPNTGGVPNLESQNLAASMAEILATAGGQLLLHTFLFYSNI